MYGNNYNASLEIDFQNWILKLRLKANNIPIKS